MPLDFKLIPDNREISEILAAQVQGAYRFTHDALKPYVRVEPSGSWSITVTAGAKLRLQRREASKMVTGPIDFAVMFYQHGLTLAEVSTPDARVVPASGFGMHEIQLGHPTVDVVPEGGHTPEPVVKPRRAPRPMALVTEPELVAPSPRPFLCELAPPWAEKIRTREQVQPELGDYLVIPNERVKKDKLPAWVVPSLHVTAMHVVKPRLGEDRELGD